MQVCAIVVFQSKLSQFEEYESSHGVLVSTYWLSGQVDQETQQEGYSKYGPPVASTRLINEFKTHRCAFDFDCKFVRSVMNDD